MNSLFLSFVFLSSSTAVLTAEEPKPRYFADGLSLEARVEKAGENLQVTVIRYDEAMDSDESLHGDLISEGEGAYRLEYKWFDEADKEHLRTGKVTIRDGSLSYAGMKETPAGEKALPASGGPWKEVPEAVVLRNAKARYEIADKLLNAAWKTAKEESGEKGLPALQKAQRDWLEYRDSMTERITWDAVRMAGGAEDPDSVDYKAIPAYWRQLTFQTVDRTPILRAWSGKSVAPGRAGVYTDSYGGVLTIGEKKDGLHFELNVVRGPTFHLGNVTGVAKLEGAVATWTDAAKPEGDKTAIIRLKFNPDRSVSIESENAGAYHGARAYFDSQFFKTGSGEKKPDGAKGE